MARFKVLAMFLSLLSGILFLHASSAANIITPNQAIVDGQTLVSSGGVFELGFFSPSGSNNRYVGMWYKTIPTQTIVWVANREAPLTSSSGILNLTTDGNLVVQYPTGHVLWSTGTSSVRDPVVQLLDSGNLVLTQGRGGSSVVWQSFDYPTDTLLPSMKLGWNLRTNHSWNLTSWKSPSDPSPGNFTWGVDLRGAQEMYVWNGASPVTRSGPWDGQSWDGPGPFTSDDIYVPDFVSNQDEVYYSYETPNKSIVTMSVLESFGVAKRFVWMSQEWSLYWYGPTDHCDHYAQCGANGVCNTGLSPICDCLTGFVPKSPQLWSMQDNSDGCVRRTALGCPTGDGFLKLSAVKLPDTSNATVNKVGVVDIDACRNGCLNNCSCMAFAFLNTTIGCITWHTALVDVRVLSQGTGDDLYLRLAASELDTQSKRKRLTLVIVLPSVALFILATLTCFLGMRRCRREAGRELSTEQLLLTLSNSIRIKLGENKECFLRFSVFNFSDIVDATNNFSDANKLGEGGFGPVYKGQLLEGQEVAIKRLATYSEQGAHEFKNEILLIAKLQHRNLVRILGCCIHEDEKILIYEYMPNKSLDLYIFDQTRREQTDWCMRFHIIEGIAQGLLYLHKHSRLQIIHRDLKTSNILLDGDMNPKISDFGTTRVFGSNETQANTKRIVGTYGYMPPEYVTEGLFSIKSDIFSFGVIVLEIISGKRNTGFNQCGNSLNLQGYAWMLWKEQKLLELVDPSLDNECHMNKIYRCIHVALMCVQESFADRPTMSDVITMLNNEGAVLPDPKKPGFFNVGITIEENSLSNNMEVCSLNEMTITAVDSR